ncbi:5013_t:CDS:2 [Racocetra persica]|uniref:5013_t:CDS:1 n=1 Tax=Racocetra persica TaxID=160502 RepID=A0ACA9MS53_9GLOM|nr:5013_t:CDS:2 [Racocetra persica]
MKDQNIENFEQVIDINEFIQINPKEITTHIVNNILEITSFKFKGWLMLTIDTNKNQATVELIHDYYPGYIDVCITDKIKEYIKNNIQQTPRILWESICTKNLNITKKQIYRL